MFAIAIWDATTRRLVMARDRLGIKPLFYAATGRGIAFASEPKTVLAGGWVEPALEESALAGYFMFRAPVAPQTLFAGVEKLPPGCWCTYDATSGLGPPRPYWQPQAFAEDRVSRDVREQRL